MIHSFLNSIRTDIKLFAQVPMVFLASLAPFFLILFLKFIYPLIADLTYENFNFDLYVYYTIVAITAVCGIPMVVGMVFSFILTDKNNTEKFQVLALNPAGQLTFRYVKILVPVFLSFILVLFTIIFTKPVPEEGWLRIIFITFLLALQTPFTILFIGSLTGNKILVFALSKLYGVFLIAVPLGLMLHQPWNYITFFSPYYWISWAWITAYPGESLLFGVISMVITIGSIILLVRYFLKKQKVQ